ncbi:MAG: magnesium/cobalt transporter CorA [Chlorobiaceae bacterium]|nr:magnesium/cobalt transporter CorA [Chlorobiaceae bacterium]
MKKERHGKQVWPIDRGRIEAAAKVLKNRTKTIGQPPGTLIHVGERQVEHPVITMIAYDAAGVTVKTLEALEECQPFRDSGKVVWVNIDGLHDIELIARAGELFGIEPLTLEDILHTGQRAKVEDFDRYLYLVLQMLEFEGDGAAVTREQLSVILADGLVVTFQEKPGDMFDAVRQRIGNSATRVRRFRADFLAYALVDAVVDHCLSMLEQIETTIDRLEEGVLEQYDRDAFESIYSLKRELIILRKSVWPLREAVGSLMRDDFKVIGQTVGPYFRDVYDHIILVIDTVEVFRDIVNGMQETYLAVVNNRMNEVMKFLTMIATIFMPLSFIAGLYGMNFHYMPELEWRWGYFAVLGLMGAIVLFMVRFYRSRKWF